MTDNRSQHSGLLNSTHRARKRFGQNFLVDHNIIDKIITAIHPGHEDRLIEIGPGQGAMTRPLLEKCPGLQAIELDHDLVSLLRDHFTHYPDFQIYQTDALKFDYRRLQRGEEPLRIAGNLPYNISTPLIFHLLEYNDIIRDMHFMLQKEVVERLAATPGNKNYGRLSVMAQYHCHVEPLFIVPPGAFRPEPKVESAIVRLVPHAELPIVADDFSIFYRLVNSCFQQRRKTIRNTLKHYLSREQMLTLPIDLSVRPETLSVENFVVLSNQIVKLN